MKFFNSRSFILSMVFFLSLQFEKDFFFQPKLVMKEKRNNRLMFSLLFLYFISFQNLFNISLVFLCGHRRENNYFVLTWIAFFSILLLLFQRSKFVF